MYIKTIKIEQAALKAWREEESLSRSRENKEWWNSVLPFKVFNIEEPGDCADDDLEFEGGGKSKKSNDHYENRRKNHNPSMIDMFSGPSSKTKEKPFS